MVGLSGAMYFTVWLEDKTSVRAAPIAGNRIICELFVKKGADINLCDELGRTASWHAMDAGHTSVKQTIEPPSPSSSANQREEEDVSVFLTTLDT